MADETTYEALIADLEATVRTLENDPLGLEEALALYEKGHGILRQAQERLTGLEGRMERLLEDGSHHELELEES